VNQGLSSKEMVMTEEPATVVQAFAERGAGLCASLKEWPHGVMD
jgi:hypothetical protein